METLLRRHPWTVELVIVAVCAALCGRAASDVVAMAHPPPLLITRPPPPKPESIPAFDKRPDAIIARNIFCSGCLPLLDDEVTPVATESPTALPLALLAVMYAGPSRLGNHSIAVLKDKDSRDIGAFVLGDQVYGATLTEIWETRVYLEHEGTRVYLDLLEAPPPRVPTVCATDAPKPKDAIAADIERGIKKLGEHRYEVQRRTIDSVLANMGLLSRSVRPIPEMKDGKLTGFRLLAVHPDGPIAKIGMKSGDVIASINGLEITSPEKVIEAFGKLKTASHLSLQLERGRQRITHDYVIR